MKKSLILLAVAAVLCSMAGCQSAQPPAVSDTPSTTSSVTATAENTTTEPATAITATPQTTTAKKAPTKTKTPTTAKKKPPTVPKKTLPNITKKPTTTQKVTPTGAPTQPTAPKKYRSMKEFANSPEMRQEAEMANKQMLSQGLHVDFIGENNQFIFAYTLLVQPDDPHSIESLEAELDADTTYYQELAVYLTDIVDVQNPVIVVRFSDPDGTKRIERKFTAP